MRYYVRFSTRSNAKVYSGDDIEIKDGRTTLWGRVTVNGRLYKHTNGKRYDREGKPIDLQVK